MRLQRRRFGHWPCGRLGPRHATPRERAPVRWSMSGVSLNRLYLRVALTRWKAAVSPVDFGVPGKVRGALQLMWRALRLSSPGRARLAGCLRRRRKTVLSCRAWCQLVPRERALSCSRPRGTSVVFHRQGCRCRWCCCGRFLYFEDCRRCVR